MGTMESKLLEQLVMRRQTPSINSLFPVIDNILGICCLLDAKYPEQITALMGYTTVSGTLIRVI
jgi:hypothetical protein